MRRLIVLVVLSGVVVLAGGCGGDDDEPETERPRAFFGWALGAPEPTGVAIDADEPAGDGSRRIRAYVCDGFGPPDGKAVWFTGTVDVDAANEFGAEGVTLTSAGGDETLVIDHFDDRVVRGSFTDGDGRRSQFAATPATAGAGIYEVTLSEDMRYTGTSMQGDELSADVGEDGVVTGRITTADDEEIEFRTRTLSLASPADLRDAGLSERYPEDRARSLQPGEYTAVITPGGTHWLGRSGNVRGGSAGNNIIGLDKAC